jgi:hypothetical protein
LVAQKNEARVLRGCRLGQYCIVRGPTRLCTDVGITAAECVQISNVTAANPKSGTQPVNGGQCEGVLRQGRVAPYLTFAHNGMCIIAQEDAPSVFGSCQIGHHCAVTGDSRPCPHADPKAGECLEISNVTGASRR